MEESVNFFSPDRQSMLTDSDGERSVNAAAADSFEFESAFTIIGSECGDPAPRSYLECKCRRLSLSLPASVLALSKRLEAHLSNIAPVGGL